MLFRSVTASGYTVTAPNGAFVAAEGGELTISGDGTLVGNENAIVANGGSATITAGSYEGFNPSTMVVEGSCSAEIDGKFVIGAHKYDDGVLSDKVTYKVDGDCEYCGFVRGYFAVDYVYYMTLEEAIAAAQEKSMTIYLATDIVIEGDVVWDLTGYTFKIGRAHV